MRWHSSAVVFSLLLLQLLVVRTEAHWFSSRHDRAFIVVPPVFTHIEVGEDGKAKDTAQKERQRLVAGRTVSLCIQFQQPSFSRPAHRDFHLYLQPAFAFFHRSSTRLNITVIKTLRSRYDARVLDSKSLADIDKTIKSLDPADEKYDVILDSLNKEKERIKKEYEDAINEDMQISACINMFRTPDRSGDQFFSYIDANPDIFYIKAHIPESLFGVAAKIKSFFGGKAYFRFAIGYKGFFYRLFNFDRKFAIIRYAKQDPDEMRENHFPGAEPDPENEDHRIVVSSLHEETKKERKIQKQLEAKKKKKQKLLQKQQQEESKYFEALAKSRQKELDQLFKEQQKEEQRELKRRLRDERRKARKESWQSFLRKLKPWRKHQEQSIPLASKDSLPNQQHVISAEQQQVPVKLFKQPKIPPLDLMVLGSDELVPEVYHSARLSESPGIMHSARSHLSDTSPSHSPIEDHDLNLRNLEDAKSHVDVDVGHTLDTVSEVSETEGSYHTLESATDDTLLVTSKNDGIQMTKKEPNKLDPKTPPNNDQLF